VLVGGDMHNRTVEAARFTPDGTFDSAFSGGESYWNLYSGSEYVHAAAVDGSGRLLIGGSQGGKYGDAFVARFLLP